MKQYGSLILTALSIACLVLGVAMVVHRYLVTHPANPAAVHCTVERAHYQIVIENNQVTPAHIDALQCDTMTILNNDPSLRLIAFGTHDHHIAYGGVTEQVLAENQSLTVTLDKTGSYVFHDHSQESVAGSFSVTR